MAETQTRVIRVFVDAKGDGDLKRIAQSMGSLNKSVKQTADAMSFFQSLTTGIAGASIFGFGVREVMQIADSMTTLASRITALTGDAEKTASVLKQLNDVANETKSNVDSIKEVYGRVAVATQRLNLTTEAQIALTKILQQSFRLSGATAAEAQAATIQFSQALSFGQLRGQELRSVLSQNAVLANIFSKAIEGSGKDIYKFAEAGGFTTKFVLKQLAENFDDVNSKADTLAQTFEQTLILATNKFKVAINDINTEFNLNGKFAKGVDYLLNNLPTVGAILAGLVTPALISFGSKIIFVISKMNPFAAVAAGIVTGLILLYQNFDRAKAGFNLFGLFFAKLGVSIRLTVFKILEDVTAMSDTLSSFFGKFKDGAMKELRDLEVESAKQMKVIREGISTSLSFEGADAGDSPISSLANPLLESINKIKDPVKSLKEQIGSLNTSFNLGKISATKYVNELERLETLQLKEKLKEGEITLKKFNEEISKNKLEGFATLLDSGSISITTFNQKVDEFKIEELKKKFNEGKISTAEYTTELVKLQKTGFGDFETYLNGFQAGVSTYLQNLGTLSFQISRVVESSFSRFEDAIFEATKGATRSFAEMAQSILDDITRIAIRMAIIQPLAQGFSGLFSGGFGGGSTGGTLAGFPGSAPLGPTLGNNTISVQPFAQGGIVESPTFFGMAGRKLGVAGEAGPEAIIPLKRGGGGQLGVGAAPVTINIVNNAGAEISTKEQTNSDGSKTIMMVINQAVKEGISNGTFDRNFQQSFGINRKGI